MKPGLIQIPGKWIRNAFRFWTERIRCLSPIGAQKIEIQEIG